jgi:hypothetical protein
MTKPITRIRASSLSGYPDCPRRWAARTLKDEIVAAGFKLRETPRTIGASIGSAVHKAAAVMLAEKARSGNLPPFSVSTDAARDAFKEDIKGGVMFDSRGPTCNAGDAEQHIANMAKVYQTSVAVHLHPVLIEERLEADVDWSSQRLVLSGQPDQVCRLPNGIADLKTGRRDGTHKPQLGAYSLLARSNGIATIEQAAVHFLARVTLKKPQPGPVTHQHDVAQVETAATNVLKHIDASVRTFREGDAERRILPGDPWAFAANPSSILCSPKYCPAHGSEFCREHAQTAEAEAA